MTHHRMLLPFNGFAGYLDPLRWRARHRAHIRRPEEKESAAVEPTIAAVPVRRTKPPCSQPHQAELDRLTETVARAAGFLRMVDETVCDGQQTARDVLAHLVFWHCAYVSMAWALATHREPPLFAGTVAQLNAFAAERYRHEPMVMLAERLMHRQKQLCKALRRLPDWTVNFPMKEGGEFESVDDRLRAIESHIRHHVARLKRATRQTL